MSEINLGPPPSSTSRRGLLIIVAVLLLLGGGIALYYSRQVAHLAVARVQTYQAHIVFNSFIAEAQGRTEDDLYVLVTLRVQNGYKTPIFLKDFAGTLTNADGEQLKSSPLQKTDVPEVVRMFPAIQPLISPTLDRETEIAPGASAEGMVVLQFSGTKEMWDKRQSADLTVTFYHQAPLTVAIP